MKKLIVGILMAFSFVAVQAQELVPIRIGWQIPWATQGQLVQIMKHTDVLKKNGLKAEFVGRTYGPELNEIALAGQVDVVLTADQPAAILFSKDKGWRGIGRLMYNRTTTYVPINSPIKSMADLRGKTIGVPFGAAAERVLVEALQRDGIHPKKDVHIVNLGMLEHIPLIRRSASDAMKWDQFDALSGFDPIPAILESRKTVRTIDVGKVVSLVLTNNEYAMKYPGVEKKIMAAFVDAYDFYRQNIKQADAWFLAEAKLTDADNQACLLAASLEPNVRVQSKSAIRVGFSDEDYLLMQRGADFIAPMIKKQINMKDFVFSP